MQRHDQSKQEFPTGGSGRPARFCGGDLGCGVTDRLGEAGETIVTAVRNGRGYLPPSGAVAAKVGESVWRTCTACGAAAAPAALRRWEVLPVTPAGPAPQPGS